MIGGGNVWRWWVVRVGGLSFEKARKEDRSWVECMESTE